MSKVNMSVTDLLALVKPVLAVEEGKLVQAPVVKVYEDNLPEGITMDIVGTVHKYDSRFFEAFGTAGSQLIAQRAKADADLAAEELKVDIAGHSLSVAFSRPVNAEPTAKEWGASIGFGYGVTKPAGLDKNARKAFAAEMMDDSDDE